MPTASAPSRRLNCKAATRPSVVLHRSRVKPSRRLAADVSGRGLFRALLTGALLVSCQSANPATSRPAAQPPSVNIHPPAALQASVPEQSPPCPEPCCDADLIADAEPFDRRAPTLTEGLWYSYADARGSTVHPPPEARGERFPMATAGANGSAGAARIFGVVARAELAAVGIAFEFTGPAGSVDASSHSGIRFAARSGGPEHSRITVSVGARGSGAELQIAPDWAEYTLRFDELVAAHDADRAATGAPPPERLREIRFEIRAPGAFDVWIDELRFVLCSNASPPGPKRAAD